MAPLPDAKHLLELLQRAAEELKASQRDTASAKAELKSAQEKLVIAEVALAEERRQRRQMSDELMSDGNTTLPPNSMRSEFTSKTVSLARSPLASEEEASRPRDEKTSVGSSDDNLLGARLAGLQEELQALEAERKQLKDRVKTLEVELANPEVAKKNAERLKGLQDEILQLEGERQLLKDRVKALELELANPEAAKKSGELEHELSNTRQQLIVEQARGADLLTRLQAWEARSQELEHSLASSRAAGDEEHAQLDQVVGQLSQVETELTTERARTQAMEEQLKSLEQGSSDEAKRLFESTSRVAQLEIEVAGLKGRRDELNLEIGKVEKDRTAARTRVTELEHAAQQVRDQLNAEHATAMEVERVKKSELEHVISKEKEKHQITAQKLLEARGKGKDTDEKLASATAQNVELTSRLEALAKAHDDERAAAAKAQTEATATLTTKVAELTAQLETATTEWRHTDRQYEQLHREMLVILDQRDEARRELETIKQRFGIR